jgi:hypothetical protein
MWLALAVFLGIPCLTLLLVPAEFSVLIQADGTTRWLHNRQFDLPTGDTAVFHDYSLTPVFWCFLACSLFYFATQRIVLSFCRPGPMCLSDESAARRRKVRG